MANEVILKLNNLNRKIKNIDLLNSKAGLAMIGKKVKQYNLEQISDFKEATGKRVKPYASKEYAEKKETTQDKVDYVGRKKTYSKKNKFKSAGHMMNAFDVKSKKGQAIISFFSDTAKELAGYNAIRRKFIGLTKKNQKLLFKWIVKKFR
jgi:hypothetical protein